LTGKKENKMLNEELTALFAQLDEEKRSHQATQKANDVLEADVQTYKESLSALEAANSSTYTQVLLALPHSLTRSPLTQTHAKRRNWKIR
jgi:chromosome segregation ATPase